MENVISFKDSNHFIFRVDICFAHLVGVYELPPAVVCVGAELVYYNLVLGLAIRMQLTPQAPYLLHSLTSAKPSLSPLKALYISRVTLAISRSIFSFV